MITYAIRNLRNIFRRTESANKAIVGIRPYRHDKGLKVGQEFIRMFHSGVYSFEIWSEEKVRVFLCSSESESDLRKKISSFYPSAEIYVPEKFFVKYGETFCAARVHLKNPILPIRTEISGDPMNALLAAMTGRTAVYQVVFTPAPSKYATKLIKASRAIQAGKVEGWINPRIIPAGKIEKELSKALAEKAKMPLYFVDIRIYIFGESYEAIRDFSAFFELFRWIDQGFRVEIANSENKRVKILEEMLMRRIEIGPLRKKNILSAEELALIAHIPGEEVTIAGNVDWTYEKKDSSPPPEL